MTPWFRMPNAFDRVITIKLTAPCGLELKLFSQLILYSPVWMGAHLEVESMVELKFHFKLVEDTFFQISLIWMMPNITNGTIPWSCRIYIYMNICSYDVEWLDLFISFSHSSVGWYLLWTDVMIVHVELPPWKLLGVHQIKNGLSHQWQ